MPRPVFGKYSLKGTRLSDVISVGENGVTVNGSFKALTPAQIDAGVVVNADRGNDTVTGGRGPDELNGGAGDDTLIGGSGLDRLNGGDGNDTLIDLDTFVTDPDPSDDVDPNAERGAIFDGGRGYDILDFSGASSGIAFFETSFDSHFTYDTVNGHPTGAFAYLDLDNRVFNIEEVIGTGFNDVLWGTGFQAWTVRGGGGNDYVVGSLRDDFLYGDAGNDVIADNGGNDHISGGSGNDSFIFGVDPMSIEGHDVIHDYADGDILVFQYAQSGPTWALGSYNGTPSLIGTYDDGQSTITLVGVTSLGPDAVQVSFGQW